MLNARQRLVGLSCAHVSACDGIPTWEGSLHTQDKTDEVNMRR
jgi:hypothetical protein